MKVTWVSVAAFAVGAFVCAGQAEAQNPFFSPPMFTGGGQTITADINGDGKPDLVSADGTVLVNNGDGTFTTGTSLSVTGNAIATGDFNGDGKADVIITSTSTTVLSVLLGNGDGTFQAAVTVNVGAALKSLVVVDFNGDGKPDVAGVNDASGLFVLLGNGSGSFTAASGSPLALPASTVIVAGDFNGDGKTDLAYGSSGSTTPAAGGVFTGNGDGTFKTGSPLAIGLTTISAVSAADLTGSGKLDLVFSGSTNNSEQTVVLIGHGDGTFQASASSLAASGDIAIADLNGDKKPDVVIDDGTVIRVFLGVGDGSFQLQNTYLQIFVSDLPSPGGSSSVLTADFNGDGKVDVAAHNLMLLGNGDGSLQGNDAIVSYALEGGLVGDFNGDSSPDVFTSDGSNLLVLLNDGTGKFIQAHSYPSSALPILTADLNHDGKLDVLVGAGSSLSVMFGNGDGTFGNAVSTGVSGSSFVSINAVDLNGDHIPDLVTLTTQGVNVYLGKGDGTFAAAVNYFAGSTPTVMQIGDVNNDGKVDVVVGSSAGVGVLFGNGDGTFAPVVLSNPGIGGSFVAVDTNGDGKLDLIAPSTGLQVYLGNGDGTFQAPIGTGAPGPVNGYSTLALGDINGDGKVDVIGGPGMWISYGNGDGTFAAPIGMLVGNRALGPFVQAIADLNGDGLADVLLSTAGLQPEQGFATYLNVNGSTGPNFAVAATPVFPASVPTGNSVTSSVTVTMSNGFSANVALSCVGLPAGASCAFAPATSSSGTVISTLTISVSATTASGTYYVGVVGTGGGLTHSRLLTLNVSPGSPDFALSIVSGATSTVTAGTTATYSISVGGIDGFGGSVSLSCSGAPMGAACTVSPAMVTVSGSSPGMASVTVTTTARSGMLAPMARRDDRWTPGIYGSRQIIAASAAVAISFGLLAICGLRLRRRFSWVAVAGGVLLVLAGIGIAGCGGSNSMGSNPSGGTATGTPAGSYNITVTATSGSGANVVSHTTQVTLVVQ